ncbi:MAG: CpaF family protein [Actinomycetia bacterium]|nr:CpaF family protein [Actinomycetes bacterium]MCP5035835.1 CpaF family protein [Actinomycetes bacterium]
MRQSGVPGSGSPRAHHRSADDPLWRLRLQAQEALFERLGRRLSDPNLSEEQIRVYVVEQLDQILEVEVRQLTSEDRHELVESISHDLLGLGPIEPFLADPSVTEIMVNGDDAIFVERGGRIYVTDARFLTIKHLRQVIERIVASVGRRIDEASPMVDARLDDGSRVNAIIPPLAVDGPMLTIRKFASSTFGAHDLIRYGTLTPQSAEFLNVCVMGRRNILISGGTGTGKTTLLNVVSSFIPMGERIITIEDSIELRLDQRHVVRLEARPANVEGRGEITIRDLVRNALRMRPDRIIVGEVRGGEALDMLQAMNTGHEGSLSTLHANSPRDALARLETMVLMAGLDLPVRAIREQVASAIDLVVHLGRLRDGSRQIVDITEITGMEGEVITTSGLYRFDPRAKNPERGGGQMGSLVPTGLRPRFFDQLADMEIELDERLLVRDPDPFASQVDLQ